MNNWSTPAAAPPKPAAGWYPDPEGEGALRYYDGNRWTDALAQQPPPAPSPAAESNVQTHLFAGGSGSAIVTPLGTTNISRILVIVGLVLLVVVGVVAMGNSNRSRDIEAVQRIAEERLNE